jgi:chromate reductase
MNPLNVAVVIGSLRKDSINRRLASAIIKLAPEGVHFKIVEIADLPLYNQDDDDHQAEAVKRIKAEIAQCHGVVFVTPEHNRSIPAALKNVLDHGSRPPGQNVWGKKPAAIIGISPSAVGTALAQQHLRAILATLDMPTLCQPEMFLQIKDGFFDDNGNIGAGSNKFIKGWLEHVHTWIKTHQAN